MIMQVLHPRRTNLLENLSALMIILPLAFCAHKQENWLLLVRSAPSPYPYPGAPYLFCSLSLVSSSKSPNTPHGGSIESRKLASSAPTGGETFYLEMEIHVQYLHLPPPAELVWDCALPNANHLRMCSKSQTDKWRNGYSFKWQGYFQWRTHDDDEMRENAAKFSWDERWTRLQSEVDSQCRTFWASCNQRPQNLKHNRVIAGPPAEWGPQSLQTTIPFVTTEVGSVYTYFIIDSVYTVLSLGDNLADNYRRSFLRTMCCCNFYFLCVNLILVSVFPWSHIFLILALKLVKTQINPHYELLLIMCYKRNEYLCKYKYLSVAYETQRLYHF